MGQVICWAFVDFAHGDSLCRNWNLISDRGLKLSQVALSPEFNPWGNFTFYHILAEGHPVLTIPFCAGKGYVYITCCRTHLLKMLAPSMLHLGVGGRYCMMFGWEGLSSTLYITQVTRINWTIENYIPLSLEYTSSWHSITKQSWVWEKKHRFVIIGCWNQQCSKWGKSHASPKFYHMTAAVSGKFCKAWHGRWGRPGQTHTSEPLAHSLTSCDQDKSESCPLTFSGRPGRGWRSPPQSPSPRPPPFCLLLTE